MSEDDLQKPPMKRVSRRRTQAPPMGTGGGQQVPPLGSPYSQQPSPDPFQKMIPAANPFALVSYYTGVFSLIPCAALLLGPGALVCGILGLKKITINPQLPGKGHAITGIILGGITTFVNYGFLIWFFVELAKQRH